MAWYNIDYACGCSGREQIYGTNRNGERDRKQAWLGTRDCKDCYAKKVASEKAAKTEAMLAAAPMVAAAAESKGCAPMVGGTPAQNAYAEILRAYVVDLADFAAKKILEKEEAGQQITDAQQSALGKIFLQLPHELRAQNNAKLWIDNAKHVDANTKVWALFSANQHDCADWINALLAGSKTAVQKMAEIRAADPQPQFSDAVQSLRQKLLAGRWNGKFYVKEKHAEFYVDSEYHKCTIAEYKQYTAERAARIEWRNKYAAEIKAAGEVVD